jgi:dihydroxy-acid dehydratase
MSEPLNRISRRITQPKSQGASQAMLYATGLTEADMDKAQVGIASVWYEGNSCNMHLNELGALVKEGVTPPGWWACASTPSASPTASRWAPRA